MAYVCFKLDRYYLLDFTWTCHAVLFLNGDLITIKYLYTGITTIVGPYDKRFHLDKLTEMFPILVHQNTVGI